MKKMINISIINKRNENNIQYILMSNKASFQLWCSHCHLNKKSRLSNCNILLIGDSHLEQY